MPRAPDLNADQAGFARDKNLQRKNKINKNKIKAAIWHVSGLRYLRAPDHDADKAGVAPAELEDDDTLADRKAYH